MMLGWVLNLGMFFSGFFWYWGVVGLGIIYCVFFGARICF